MGVAGMFAGRLPWRKVMPLVALAELLQLAACVPPQATASRDVDWQAMYESQTAAGAPAERFGHIGFWY